MKSICLAVILKNRILAPNIMDMTLLLPEIAKAAKPGQFINMYTGKADTILPRPISISEIDAENGTLRVIYSIVGKGTEVFSRLEPGDEIKVLGPLGNGFTIMENARKSILVAGGIGAPPMLGLAKAISGDIEVYLGARDKNILADEFKALGAKVFLASDNGSEGFNGNVVKLMEAENANGDIIYSCGPKIMLKNLCVYAAGAGIDIQVSMEERMACGIGACVGCAIKIKNGENGFNNLKVCKDGPVFNGSEVLWD